VRQLFLSHHPQFSPLCEVVSLCKKYGCGLEMSAFASIESLDDQTLIETQRAGAAGILWRSIHGPYLDLYPGHPNPAVRERTRLCFQQIYRIAVWLNARHLIFHHNFDPQASSPEVWLKYSSAFWKNYLAECPGVSVHLENVMDANPELVSAVIEEVASPCLDIALDIGHVHCYSQADLNKWISALGSRIGYVHLHDNHGREDEHLALGEGNIALVEILALLKSRAPAAVWSLESGGPKMYQSLQWLNENHYLNGPLPT
jgi:sugar phosphate isomerase/epimerase